ncbi:MAG TPA: RidA family protein [Thermoplasmata archaeon]|nr:RidA family protein [Thermoplasmata archaeon]
MPRPPPSLRFLNPPTLSPPAGYSHVAEATGGRILFLSGQVALEAAGKLVGPNDLAAQARQVFKNIQAGLQAAGTDFAHVVKLTYYLVDASQIAVVREVRDQFVDTKHPPASTAVEIRRLVREDFLIEVDAVAIAPA